MTLQLKKFDITTISQDSVCVFVGMRRTGKSILIKDLLYYNRDVPIATVISGTESASPYYGDFLPSLFIHDEYSPDLLKNVVDRQKIIKHKMAKSKKKGKECNIDPRAILLLDDCLYDSSWAKDVNIRCMFMNGRHYNMLFLLAMQYPLGIPPNLRTNIDYSFILRECNFNNRRRIYDNYASVFPTFEMFCTVMDQCTNDYEVLVINNSCNSNRMQDKVFWYKADLHTNNPFKVGAKEFWDAHYHNLAQQENVDSEDEEDMFDASQYMKKNKCRVKVKKTHHARAR